MDGRVYLDVYHTRVTDSLLDFYEKSISQAWMGQRTFILNTPIKEIVVDCSKAKSPNDLEYKFYKKLEQLCNEAGAESDLIRHRRIKLEKMLGIDYWK